METRNVYLYSFLPVAIFALFANLDKKEKCLFLLIHLIFLAEMVFNIDAIMYSTCCRGKL